MWLILTATFAVASLAPMATALATSNSGLGVAIIGGVFLIANGVITLLLGRYLSRDDREYVREFRRRNDDDTNTVTPSHPDVVDSPGGDVSAGPE